MKKLNSMKSLTIFVIACLILVILYVIAAIVIEVTTNKVLPDSLNQGVLLLFGSELAVSGFIKIFKIKGGQNDGNNDV